MTRPTTSRTSPPPDPIGRGPVRRRQPVPPVPEDEDPLPPPPEGRVARIGRRRRRVENLELPPEE